MDTLIGAKELRLKLGTIVQRARSGERITVLYRNRPAFRIVAVSDDEASPASAGDSLLGARAVGRSRDGRSSRDHDEDLYGSLR